MISVTTKGRRSEAETIVAAALLKAFSAEVSSECRIMLGRYANQIAFQDHSYRLVQLAFYMNISPESVDNPNTVIDTAEMMGADCNHLLDVFVFTADLYHAIVYLTGAVFDLSEIIERVALRDGE